MCVCVCVCVCMLCIKKKNWLRRSKRGLTQVRVREQAVEGIGLSKTAWGLVSSDSEQGVLQSGPVERERGGFAFHAGCKMTWSVHFC